MLQQRKLSERSQTQKDYILYDSICIKFPEKSNLCSWDADQWLHGLESGGTQTGMREIFELVEMHNWFMVMVVQVCECKNHRMAHYKQATWFYELYLNKAVNLKNKLFGILNIAMLVVFFQDRLLEHPVDCVAQNWQPVLPFFRHHNKSKWITVPSSLWIRWSDVPKEREVPYLWFKETSAVQTLQ